MSVDASTKERPAWLEDTSITPPYPVLRCPRCKALFDDYSIHLCKPKDGV